MTKAQLLLKKFNNSKTLPQVAIRLSRLISDENSSIRDFAEIIEMDPSLVVRLLRVVNSAYYGLRQKVDSIARAVIFIGTKSLHNLVVIEALKDVFRKSPHEDIFSRRILWLHCAAVSICNKMISERIFEQKGEDAFLCGILHDIGMIVEDQVVEDLFLQVCTTYEPESGQITKYEREIIGTDHCMIGYDLAREWKLLPEIQQGIKNHHKMRETTSPSGITGITQISEFFVSRLGYPALPGVKATLPPDLANHIQNNSNEYKALVRDLPDEMAKAKDLYEIQEG